MIKPTKPWRYFKSHYGPQFASGDDPRLQEFVDWADKVGAPYGEVKVAISRDYSDGAEGELTWHEVTETDADFAVRLARYEVELAEWQGWNKSDQIAKLEKQLEELKGGVSYD